MSTNSVDAGHLRAFIERVERLEEEKAAIASDVKEVFVEIKSAGYDARIVKRVLAIRKKGEQAAAEEAELLGLYLNAIGVQIEMPL